MYLKELYIYETVPTEKIIREIKFSLGMNYIVDEGSPEKKGNGVGKTTLLKLINLAFGAKEKKSIYYDSELKSTNEEVKSYIEDHQVEIKLVLSSDLKETEKENLLNLKVGLYHRSKNYINDIYYNQNDYRTALNKKLFDNSYDDPSFRQLIPLFIRIGNETDNNRFLKFLHPSTTNNDYEKIYNFLFELTNQDHSLYLSNLKEEQKKSEEALQVYKDTNQFDSVDEITQTIELLKANINEDENILNSLVDEEKFKENEKSINQLNNKYWEINEQIDGITYLVNRANESISEAESDNKSKVDYDLLTNLFEEANTNFENIEKSFEELVEFNFKLNNNKINYFLKIREKKQQELSDLYKERDELFVNNKDMLIIIEDNKVSEYYSLKSQIDEANIKLGKYLEMNHTFETLNHNINKTKNEIDELNNNIEYSSENIAIFNTYFSEYTEKTTDTKCLLYKTDSGFPLGIKNLDDNASTGIRKTLIASFDLAYQGLVSEINKTSPRFVIHDVIETIDSYALNALINIVNDNEYQYVIAVLKDKLDDNIKYSDDEIKLTLKENDKLFRI